MTTEHLNVEIIERSLQYRQPYPDRIEISQAREVVAYERELFLSTSCFFTIRFMTVINLPSNMSLSLFLSLSLIFSLFVSPLDRSARIEHVRTPLYHAIITVITNWNRKQEKTITLAEQQSHDSTHCNLRLAYYLVTFCFSAPNQAKLFLYHSLPAPSPTPPLAVATLSKSAGRDNLLLLMFARASVLASGSCTHLFWTPCRVKIQRMVQHLGAWGICLREVILPYMNIAVLVWLTLCLYNSIQNMTRGWSRVSVSNPCMIWLSLRAISKVGTGSFTNDWSVPFLWPNLKSEL